MNALVPIWNSLLRCSAAALLAVYVAWNMYWLSQVKLAPSLFQSLTCLPCATTGGTRSFVSALGGDWEASLSHNPMTLPILITLALSVFFVCNQIWRSHPVNLPRWLMVTWFSVLSVAWCYKLFQWAAGQVT